MSRIATLTAALCMVVTSSAVARPIHPHETTGGGSVNWVVLAIAVGALVAAGVMTARAGRTTRL
jgi:hypothetical protein